MQAHIKNSFALEHSREQKQICAKRYINRFRNGNEKAEETNKQINRHFRIYNSRDFHNFKFCCTGLKWNYDNFIQIKSN